MGGDQPKGDQHQLEDAHHFIEKICTVGGKPQKAAHQNDEKAVDESGDANGHT
ncbi:MAG: hypothetical protein AAGG79_01725 [Pseudomonadota bacterium]